jgi:hypothetical protein
MGRDGPPGQGGTDARVNQAPANGVDPGWLDLRGPADVRARTTYAAELTALLNRHLSHRLHDDNAEVRLVDVGAGTGTGAGWLRDRLPWEQDWRLVDHDPRLLAVAPATGEGWARVVVAGVADLPALLADEPAHVVTCQALLDILTAEEADAVISPAVASGAALLLSLNVTGEVEISPPHPDDAFVAHAFDAHQRRAGRLGPDAGAYAARVLRDQGYDVTMAATSWHLGAAESALTRVWLEGRASAAAEQRPDEAVRIGRWLENRDWLAQQGELTAVVGHVDVLALPARWEATA